MKTTIIHNVNNSVLEKPLPKNIGGSFKLVMCGYNNKELLPAFFRQYRAYVKRVKKYDNG